MCSVSFFGYQIGCPLGHRQRLASSVTGPVLRTAQLLAQRTSAGLCTPTRFLVRFSAMIAVCIPSVGQQVHGESEKVHTVFKVEVLTNGRKHVLEKRFKEFHALHKKIKKTYRVPEFPPKRLPNWRSKAPEHRRQSLETYIQGVLGDNENIPAEVLDFLNIRHFPAESKANSLDNSWDEPESLENSFRLTHKPVVGFCRDPYAHSSMVGATHGSKDNSTDCLPDIIVEGVLQGLYLLNGNFNCTVAQLTPNGE